MIAVIPTIALLLQPPGGAIDPHRVLTRESVEHLEKAKIHRARGDWELAREELRSVYNAAPHYGPGAFNLAVAEQALGNAEEARSLYESYRYAATSAEAAVIDRALADLDRSAGGPDPAKRRRGVVLTAVGGVSLGVAAIGMGIGAWQYSLGTTANTDCSQFDCTQNYRGRSIAGWTVMGIGMSAGLATLIPGILLLKRNPKQASVALAPTRRGIQLTGRF